MRIGKLLTLSNNLLFQLALADFALGCSLLYNAFTFAFRGLVVGHNLCALRQAMYLFPGTASVMGILVITCDRHLAIVHPLTYQVNPRQRYYVMYTLIIWIPSAIFGFLLPMLWHNLCPPECTFILILTTPYLKYGFLPFFVLLAFPMTALYAHILFTAKKQLRSIINGVPGQPQGNVYSKGQMKILKAGVLVFATFYIFWLPFLVILGLQIYSGQMDPSSPMSLARSFTMGLIPINSLLNPVIYAYRLPGLKTEISNMFRKRTSVVKLENASSLSRE